MSLAHLAVPSSFSSSLSQFSSSQSSSSSSSSSPSTFLQSTNVSSFPSSLFRNRMATVLDDNNGVKSTSTTTGFPHQRNTFGSSVTKSGTGSTNIIDVTSRKQSLFRFLLQGVQNNSSKRQFNDFTLTHSNASNAIAPFMSNNGSIFNLSTSQNFNSILNTTISDLQNYNVTHSALLSGGTGIGPPTQGRPLKWGMLALTIVILCTAVGNLLVCLAVCWERRLQNMTNYFLMSLAIADFLVSLLVMPLGMVVAIYGHFPLNPELCVLWATSDVLMCTASIWHMCTMSMDRFFTLKYPMRYGRNKTRGMVIGKILFVWIVSLAISCPIGIMGLIDRTAVFNDGVCVPSVENFVFYGSIFAFYIPLFIMLITYVLTIRILWKNQKRMKNIERSELKPRLAQLTAQCTGFAVPKLLNNIRKQQQMNGRKDEKLKVKSTIGNGPSSQTDQQFSCSDVTDDRAALSSTYDPYEAQDLGHEQEVRVTNSSTVVDSRGMSYLPLPDPHSYLTTPSSRSVSPCSTSSCNYSLSSDNDEDSGEDAKYVSLLKSSPSFRSLCSPPSAVSTRASSDSHTSAPKRRQRKLSYKERQKRLLQQQPQQNKHRHQHKQLQQQQQQQNTYKLKDNAKHKLKENAQQNVQTPLISIEQPSSNSYLELDIDSDQENFQLNPNNNIKTDSDNNGPLSNPNKNPIGCESLKAIDALVNTFSLLSSPLHIPWDSQRQLSCPSSPSPICNLTPSQHSLSLPGLSPANSNTTLLSTSVSASPFTTAPPELNVQQPSTDSSSLSQLDVSRGILFNKNQRNRSLGAFPDFSANNSNWTTSTRGIPGQLEVPCPGYVNNKKLPVTRTTSGPILGGAKSDSNVCQTGLGVKTNESGRRGLGSYPLSCGNLSKDYKSMEWDRRYFQIQEEMDELLRESVDRNNASPGEDDDNDQTDESTTPNSPLLTPDSPLTTPKSVDYLSTVDRGTKENEPCFFGSRSMPNSPTKCKRRRKKMVLTTTESLLVDNNEEADDEEGNENEEEFSSDDDSSCDNEVFACQSSPSNSGNIGSEESQVNAEDSLCFEKDHRVETNLADTTSDCVDDSPSNDIIKICLHPPMSESVELGSSNQNTSLSLSNVSIGDCENREVANTVNSSLREDVLGVRKSDCLNADEPHHKDSGSENLSFISSNVTLNCTSNNDLSEHRLAAPGCYEGGTFPLSTTTSSSHIEGNAVSEADLTLDETDDTLDGDPRQECIPPEKGTAMSKEDGKKHLGATGDHSKHSHWSLFRKLSTNSSTRAKRNNKYNVKKASSSSSFTNHNHQHASNTFRMRTLGGGNSGTTYGEDSQCDSNCSEASSQNTRICVRNSQHVNNNNNNNKSLNPAKHILSKKTASNEKKASKVLGIIFVVFVILWAPFFIVNIASTLYPSIIASITENGMSLIVWLGYVASLANPIIYTMFNTAFRRTFVNILTCKLDSGHCVLFASSSRRNRRDVRLRRRRRMDRGGGMRRPIPSYSTMVASGDRRNTVTLVLKDESR